MLRIGRDVAWLRLGSRTDHVINAAAATPDSAIRLDLQFAYASRQGLADRGRQVADERNDTFDRWHAHGALRLIQNFDQPVQCLGR